MKQSKSSMSELILPCQGSVSKSLRRYHLRIGAAMGLYVVLTALTERVLRHGTHVRGWLYVLVFLPAAPMLASIVIAGRYVAEETDEYQRYRFLQALLIATGALLSLIAINDFLRAYAIAEIMPPFAGIVLFFTTIAIVSMIQTRIDKRRL